MERGNSAQTRRKSIDDISTRESLVSHGVRGVGPVDSFLIIPSPVSGDESKQVCLQSLRICRAAWRHRDREALGVSTTSTRLGSHQSLELFP